MVSMSALHGGFCVLRMGTRGLRLHTGRVLERQASRQVDDEDNCLSKIAN